MKMSQWIFPTLITVALGLHALQSSAGEAKPVMPSTTDYSEQAARGMAFAQVRCAGCHSLTANAGSPNPEAPPFEAVVNADGVTLTTLKAFLRDSHSYPQAMNFTVASTDIDDLAEFMLTLKTARFRPAI
jgi:mono/diheme cytochrome c family protein